VNLTAIIELVERYNNHELQQAEADLVEDRPTTILIQGADQGEQLTHVLAALWVVQYIKESDCSVPDAVRAYAYRVRNSIG